MARCPQCGMEVTDFANHRHDSLANYIPWPLRVVRWAFHRLRRQPEPMSAIHGDRRDAIVYADGTVLTTHKGRGWIGWVIGGSLVAVVVIVALVSSFSSSSPSGPSPLGTSVEFSQSGGSTMSITVDKVVAPAKASPNQLQASEGDEFVGVKMTVVNSSSSNEVVDLSAITVLEDTSGQSFDWDPTTLADCPPLGSDGLATLAPGSSVSGCTAFQAPKGDTFSRVTVGSDGKTPGVWTIGGGQ